LLQWARRQGWQTAQARCYAAEGGLAYGPVADWLRIPALRLARRSLDTLWLAEVSRVLPELLAAHPDLSPPAPLTEGWQRRRLFEALARAMLATGRPLVLLLDDLQWADRDTLEWLHFLLRFDTAAHLLIVITVRAEEVAEDHPLHQLLDATQRERRLTQLDLSPLSFAETATLGAQLAGHALAVEHSEQLFAETEGNPLFIVELVRAGVQREDEARRGPSPASNATRLPAGIQRTIERRFAGLSTAARELLSLAAVLGRAFSLPALLAATESPSAMIDALDELCRRRIFREQGGDDYDFSHEKLRAVAYAALGQARRRLLHQRAAEALAAAAPANLDAVSGQIAAHYQAAGLLTLAVDHYRRAAASAAAVFANQEAIALLRRALDLTQNAISERTAITRDLGAVLHRTGAFDAAREVYEDALQTLPLDDRVARARLLCDAANASVAQKRPAPALAAVAAAESALGDAPDDDPTWWPVWVDVQLLRMTGHYWLGEAAQMEALAEQVGPAIQRYGTPMQWSQLLVSLNNMACFRNRFRISESMLERQREILRIRQEHGALASLTSAHFEMGFTLLWYGDRVKAEHHLQTALELAERSGNLADQARALVYLAVTARFAGRVPDVVMRCERLSHCAQIIDDHEYVGASEAGIAWAELRSGRPAAARAHAEVALERWQHSAFPFRWMAAWPLLGVVLDAGCVDTALDMAHLLLDPAQQRMPEILELALEDAVRLAEAGDTGAARVRLEQAREPARTLGYL
jgi:tetratricopeptide (TPR) repeat protein